MNIDSTPSLADVPKMDAWLTFAGRVLIAVLFLPDGIGKVFRLGAISGMVASRGLPMVDMVTWGVIALQVLASLAILAGIWTRWAALALAMFALLAAFLFHNFWAAPADMFLFQQISFFKNMGLAGGLLILAAAGPGQLSLEARRNAR